MPSLSTPTGDLQSDYGVVIVGSGYGGAITAYRMAAQAKALAKRLGEDLPKYSVCVLERGTERQAGDFPSTLSGAILDTQADTKAGRVGSRTALFDFRMNHDISVLVGCGLGGGSLINAAVMLAPTDAVLADERWPAELRNPRRFRRLFKVVNGNLDVSSCPPDVELDKVTWLKDAVDPEKIAAAPVAISFQTKVNQFHVQQQRCVLCGNCMSGCNHSAKNTVAANYLPGAANAGAAIFCGVETRAIEKGPDNTWLVHVRLNDKTLRPFGNPEMVIRARMVFLSAGTLGSTEILLRSRDRYGLSVSDALGRHFSGNGDMIAFGYNTPARANGFGYGRVVSPKAMVGPTIAAMVDERSKPGATGAMIQEGAIPGALRFPLRFGAPVMARATNLVADGSFDLGFRHILREIDSAIRGVRHGALARTQTFLVMGLDDGRGRMRMADDRLRIIWENVGYQELYRKVSRRLQQITRAMKGRYVINPFWSRVFGRRLLTVHPLGGCAIGGSAATAVVNANGEVFDASDPAGQAHPGLYVCDGSIIPMPLGTNPSLTISALAEHISRPARISPLLAGAPRPTRMPQRIRRWVPGIQYAERTRGTLRPSDTAGVERTTRVEATLRISAESVAELISNDNHTAHVIGVVNTPKLDPDHRRWTVTDGTLGVMIDDPRAVDTKLLVYRLKLTARDGTQWWLRGHKTVNLGTLRRHPWRTLTSVPFVIYNADPCDRDDRALPAVCHAVEVWDATCQCTDGRIIGGGRLQSSAADAMRLAATMRIVREPNMWRRFRWRWRFTWGLFLKTVIQQRVWAVRTTRSINPFDVCGPDDLHAATSALGTRHEDEEAKKQGKPPRFEVTRYRDSSSQSRAKGPVLLAPGFGMSTLAFYAAGRDSFAQYLLDQGYDVWLFDYRVSDKLAASLTQFDIDQLAQEDFPDAIECVHSIAGQRVRVVAHCLSSMTMQMSLLDGKIDKRCVRSMVLSQSFAFMDLPWPTRLKVRLHLPEVLKYLNFSPVVTSDFDRQSSFGVRLLDRLLYFFPSKERCYEGVCRRLLFMYGEVVCHDNLDKKTHETFYQLFDRGNLAAFKHIGRMFILGHISDKHGKNRYLTPKNAANVKIPLTLLQGTRNNMFRPAGAHKTHQWLVEHGAFDRATNAERITLVPSPGFGHLDSFLGVNAKRVVFPQILAALERMDGLN